MVIEEHDLLKDIEAVKSIPIVPMMLDVICQTTGMGFAAIARVTEDRWIACSVRDEINFGLEAGGELEVATTICNEIRDSRQPVVIDHVDMDPLFREHHTPRMYGLQSYISFPIVLKNGKFFGTLCAIDSRPAKVDNEKVKGTFAMFAELLSFHLQSFDIIERGQNAYLELSRKNQALESANYELDNFFYTASHDLKSPVSNIEGLIHVLKDAVRKDEINRDELYQIIALMEASVNRFAVTIKDLTTVIENQNTDEPLSEELNVSEIVEDIKMDIGNLMEKSGGKITVTCEEGILLPFSRKELKSILHNLISNAVKYSSPERVPVVEVTLGAKNEGTFLSVRDNGLGIPASKKEKIFMLFERLHNHVEGTGIGLYIVKRMIDHVGGKIQVESIVGEGTTFTIVF